MTGPLDIEKYHTDDRYFCEQLIEIDDRDGNTISFVFNPAQEILQGGLTGRDVVIKAGQLGITTFFLARDFKATITTPNTTSVVVAHEEFLTTRLLNRVQVWYDRIPKILETNVGNLEKPRQSYKGANQKYFPDINSSFYIGTARAFVFGRGEPIHRFIGSEVAFWPDPWRILTPTMQRVPRGGEMVLESTPHGAGDNAFYELVMEALDQTGIWTLHQLTWWLEPAYRIARGDKAALRADRGELFYTEEELALVKLAGWTDDTEVEERIRWRRRKIAEIKRDFWGEFYEDIISCFLSSSTPFYDADILDYLRMSCYAYTRRWLHAEIWREPDYEDFAYPNFIVSVDPGQGKITQSVATVWYIHPEDGSAIHCATMMGLYDPQTFAPMVMELANFYLGAKIVAERNGHGMAFCLEVKGYHNLYRQTEIVSLKRTKVIGWKTTGQPKIGSNGTKTYMLDELSHLLPKLICNDINIINQLSYVNVGPNNVIQFSGPDDIHDSVAIMAATRHTASGHVEKGFVGTKGWKN